MKALLLAAIPYLLGASFILGCGWYVYHKGDAHGEAKQAVKTAKVQKDFDNFVRDSDAKATAQIAKNAADKAAAETTNAQTLATFRSQRDAAIASRDSTAKLLHDTIAKASRSAVPQAGDQSGADAASAEEFATRLGQVVAGLRSECTQNADELDALQTELTPQL